MQQRKSPRRSYLISVVKLVVHKPGYDAGLPCGLVTQEHLSSITSRRHTIRRIRTASVAVPTAELQKPKPHQFVFREWGNGVGGHGDTQPAGAISIISVADLDGGRPSLSAPMNRLGPRGCSVSVLSSHNSPLCSSQDTTPSLARASAVLSGAYPPNAIYLILLLVRLESVSARRRTRWYLVRFQKTLTPVSNRTSIQWTPGTRVPKVYTAISTGAV